MTKAKRNRYMGILLPPAQEAAIVHETKVDLLTQRRAFLASGQCPTPAIAADIRRQIADLERELAQEGR